MTTDDIVTALKAGDCLHIRKERTAFGAPAAGLAERGPVSLRAALAAVTAENIFRCYEGDGECFEWRGN